MDKKKQTIDGNWWEVVVIPDIDVIAIKVFPGDPRLDPVRVIVQAPDACHALTAGCEGIDSIKEVTVRPFECSVVPWKW